jgi:hypothetical protein
MTNRWHIWRTVGAFSEAVFVLHYEDPREGPDRNWTTYVPERIRGLGPWWGYKSGLVVRLYPLYRCALASQGYMVMGLEQASKIERPRRRHVRLRAGCFKPISASCPRSSPRQSP